MFDQILHPRADVARRLSISLRKLDELISERKIRIVKIGRRVLIAESELRRFAARGTSAKRRRGGKNGE